MEENKNILDSLLVRKTEVPDDDYFKSLKESVISSEKVKIIPFYKRKITWIGAAAAVLFIVLLTNLIPKNTEKQNEQLFATVEENEISDYIEANIEEFDIEMLAEFLPEQISPLDTLKREIIENTVMEDKIPLEEINEEDILKYLQKEGLEVEELEEETFI